MIPCTIVGVSNSLRFWSYATVAGNIVPPRDPDGEDEAEDEEDDDLNENQEPAIIREPDE